MYRGTDGTSMQNSRIAEFRAFGESIGFQIDSSTDIGPSTGTWSFSFYFYKGNFHYMCNDLVI